MQGALMVMPEKETKMTKIQMFVSIFCHCHVGTAKERKTSRPCVWDCLGLADSMNRGIKKAVFNHS